MDDLASQVADLVFQNKELNDKIKEKTTPWIMGGSAYLLILVLLLIVILIEIRSVKQLVCKLSNGCDLG